MITDFPKVSLVQTFQNSITIPSNPCSSQNPMWFKKSRNSTSICKWSNRPNTYSNTSSFELANPLWSNFPCYNFVNKQAVISFTVHPNKTCFFIMQQWKSFGKKLKNRKRRKKMKSLKNMWAQYCFEDDIKQWKLIFCYQPNNWRGKSNWQKWWCQLLVVEMALLHSHQIFEFE